LLALAIDIQRASNSVHSLCRAKATAAFDSYSFFSYSVCVHWVNIHMMNDAEIAAAEEEEEEEGK